MPFCLQRKWSYSWLVKCWYLYVSGCKVGERVTVSYSYDKNRGMVSPITRIKPVKQYLSSFLSQHPSFVQACSLQHQEPFIACPDSLKTRAVLYCLVAEVRAPH